jgi:predicted nuclease of predicted toxin-antitoxin system
MPANDGLGTDNGNFALTFWIDAQLSPALAPWLTDTFGVAALSLKRLGDRDVSDREIFQSARDAKAVVITKDSDFVRLLERFGPPPQVVWVTLGNTSNANMKAVLSKAFVQAKALFAAGEPLVEITAA